MEEPTVWETGLLAAGLNPKRMSDEFRRITLVRRMDERKRERGREARASYRRHGDRGRLIRELIEDAGATPHGARSAALNAYLKRHRPAEFTRRQAPRRDRGDGRFRYLGGAP